MKKILLVDDDVDILEALQITFELEGYDTLATSTGNKAFRLVGTFKPDVIILDMMLDKIDGRDICKRIKKDESTKEIPIVMISAYPNASESILAAGADAFVAKPFDILEVVTQVSKVMQKSLVA